MVTHNQISYRATLVRRASERIARPHEAPRRRARATMTTATAPRALRVVASAPSRRLASPARGVAPRFTRARPPRRPSFPPEIEIARGSVVVAALPSLVPENADDALGRFRKVMCGLYLAGGALHVPDLFGSGPMSAATGTSSFADLSLVLRAVTLGWSVLGPVAAFGLGVGAWWGEAILVFVASAEIVLGVDFADAMAPAAIPPPVVAAQVACLFSNVAIRGWKTTEGANASGGGEE